MKISKKMHLLTILLATSIRSAWGMENPKNSCKKVASEEKIEKNEGIFVKNLEMFFTNITNAPAKKVLDQTGKQIIVGHKGDDLYCLVELAESPTFTKPTVQEVYRLKIADIDLHDLSIKKTEQSLYQLLTEMPEDEKNEILGSTEKLNKFFDVCIEKDNFPDFYPSKTELSDDDVANPKIFGDRTFKWVKLNNDKNSVFDNTGKIKTQMLLKRLQDITSKNRAPNKIEKIKKIEKIENNKKKNKIKIDNKKCENTCAALASAFLCGITGSVIAYCEDEIAVCKNHSWLTNFFGLGLVAWSSQVFTTKSKSKTNKWVAGAGFLGGAIGYFCGKPLVKKVIEAGSVQNAFKKIREQFIRKNSYPI
jgi:hypothetical protein